MTRTTLLLALGFSALLLLPLAAAQQQGTLMLRIAPPDRSLAAGTTTPVPGTLSFTFDNSASVTQPAGIPVKYTVAHAPNGTVVTISPSTDIIPTDVGGDSVGVQRTVTRSFTVTVQVGKDAPADALDVVDLVAATQPSAGSNWFTTQTRFAVHLVNGDACPPATTSASAPATNTASASSASAPHADASAPAATAPVRVQSAAPTTSFPVAPVAAVGGFAIVGAAVGVLLRRRS